MQQPLTQTIHIPVRNVAKEKALTTAARMVRRLTSTVNTTRV